MSEVQIIFLVEPSTDQLRAIVGLYRQAGWWPEAEVEDYQRLTRLVKQSHCFAAAIVDGELIGMGRAISDGVSDAYVQDVTVDLFWRGQGIGSRIVRRIVERLKQDGLGWIGLIAERGSSPFYEQFGFMEMVNSQPMLLTLS
ncbi:MAG: GNAT family N-acetyltransferase [Proteobacteria bacterium]|nr:GNAT family N-acetyltransferase [Desulfobulbaceae bacterium]MBU4153217.1 GNAT family N-acetyltransferase [Pseudomonadota bacterium]MDP2105338.1 GNAT family N-acetyltransferase [Desulfobulbaceae bacterium]